MATHLSTLTALFLGLVCCRTIGAEFGGVDSLYLLQRGTLVAAIPPMVPAGYARRELQASVFKTSVVSNIIARITNTTVNEVFLLVAPDNGAVEMKKHNINYFVLVNAAAREVYGSGPPGPSDDFAFIEYPDRTFRHAESERMKRLGIVGGFEQGQLYVTLSPFVLKPETANKDKLLYESWHLFVRSPDGTVAPLVSVASKTSAGAPATRPPQASSSKQKGDYHLLYKSPDGLRIQEPLLRVD